MKTKLIILGVVLLAGLGVAWWLTSANNEEYDPAQVSKNQAEEMAAEKEQVQTAGGLENQSGSEESAAPVVKRLKEYQVVSEDSALVWAAARIVGNSHTGEVKIKNGRALINDELEVDEANFVIDMTTISESNNNQLFLRDVKSGNFFEVDTYPAAEFRVVSVTPLAGSPDTFNVKGILEIKKINNEITFPAVIKFVESGKIEAAANFSIDRTLWDIRYDSAKFFGSIGDRAIKDEIQFKLKLVLVSK